MDVIAQKLSLDFCFLTVLTPASFSSKQHQIYNLDYEKKWERDEAKDVWERTGKRNIFDSLIKTGTG